MYPKSSPESALDILEASLKKKQSLLSSTPYMQYFSMQSECHFSPLPSWQMATREAEAAVDKVFPYPVILLFLGAPH